MLSLEHLLPIDPGIANLITILQFSCISVISVPRKFNVDIQSIRLYAILIGLFGVASYLSNSVFEYGVDVPLQLTLRSSAVLWSMVVGALLFRKRYLCVQIFAGICIAVGASLISLVEINLEQEIDIWKFQGVGLLVISLVLSACLGHLQSIAFEKYKISWKGEIF
jgi:peptidoglycan/LPS O-acetylase OafA/YrhL